MATQAEFEAAFAELDAETTRIGAVIDDLVAKLNAGGLTAEQETAILAQVKAETDKLRALGANPPA